MLIRVGYILHLLSISVPYNHPENYTKLCDITVNISHLPQPVKKGPDGDMYHEVEYDIVMMLGLTEFKVQLAWKENVCNFCTHYEHRADSYNGTYRASRRGG